MSGTPTGRAGLATCCRYESSCVLLTSRAFVPSFSNCLGSTFSVKHSCVSPESAASPTPARVPHPTCEGRQLQRSHRNSSDRTPHLVKRYQRVELHHGKEVSKSDLINFWSGTVSGNRTVVKTHPGGDVDDVAGSVPQVRRKLRRSRDGEPDQPAEDDVPCRKVVSAVLVLPERFDAEVQDEAWAREEREGVQKLRDSSQLTFKAWSSSITLSIIVKAENSAVRVEHARQVAEGRTGERMPHPDMTLHEDGPQVRSPSIPSPPEHLLQKPPVEIGRAHV